MRSDEDVESVLGNSITPHSVVESDLPAVSGRRRQTVDCEGWTDVSDEGTAAVPIYKNQWIWETTKAVEGRASDDD